MAHPQNSFRGLFAKKRTHIESLQLGASFQPVINTNSTAKAIVHSAGTAKLPGSVDAGIAFAFVSDSTGVSIALNTSGTTWKYARMTGVRADAI